MIALSVRQPWAWLIVNGIKTVENRTWATKYRGPLLIHASKTFALTQIDLSELRRDFHTEFGIIIPEPLPTGGVVGVVDLVDCVTECTDEIDADWHEEGCYAFILRNAKPLPYKPLSGRLGLFTVDEISI